MFILHWVTLFLKVLLKSHPINSDSVYPCFSLFKARRIVFLYCHLCLNMHQVYTIIHLTFLVEKMCQCTLAPCPFTLPPASYHSFPCPLPTEHWSRFKLIYTWCFTQLLLVDNAVYLQAFKHWRIQWRMGLMPPFHAISGLCPPPPLPKCLDPLLKGLYNTWSTH